MLCGNQCKDVVVVVRWPLVSHCVVRFVRVIGRSHMTIGMTTGWQTGRHTDRRYRSHMTTGVQTGVPTDRRYVHT